MDISTSKSSKPDWAWLPEEILFLIVSEVLLLSDLFSFGDVCRRWRAAFRCRYPELGIAPNMSFSWRLPMLLIPTDPCSDYMRNLYNVPDGEVYDLRLPVPFNNRCIGSSHGWLIFIDKVSFVIYLFNPFHFGNWRGIINLPVFLPACPAFESLDDEEFFPDYFVCKAILSANPSYTSDYTVILIYGESRKLAYYRPGDGAWVLVCAHDHTPFYDLLHYEGRLVAVDLWGKLYTLDIEDLNSRLTPVSEINSLLKENYRRYIVLSEDGDTLYQVERLADPSVDSDFNKIIQTNDFTVFKLETGEGLWKWKLVTTIGDGALFLGDNYSCHVDASDFPGIKPNCIYFTDDYRDSYLDYYEPDRWEGTSDDGVFQIDTGTFLERLKLPPRQSYRSPPIWVLPSF